MNILIVEDERALCTALTELLTQQGFQVDAVYNGQSGEEYALSGIYDVILLDIMLPQKNGLDVLRALRQSKLSTPILLLTAKSDVRDKIEGLDVGADDYLTKPFSTGELLARVRALTRRKGDYLGEELALGDTMLHKNTRRLSCRGSDVKLGGKEYALMEFLMQNSRQVVPRERLIEKAWGFDYDAEYNTVEVYISFIRKKLAAIQADIQIKSIRGVGYALEECV